MRLLVVKSPNVELAATNCAIVNPNEIMAQCDHVRLSVSGGAHCVLNVQPSPLVSKGQISLSLQQRKWLLCELDMPIEALFINSGQASLLPVVGTLKLLVDFTVKNKQVNEVFKTDSITKAIMERASVLSVNTAQPFLVSFTSNTLLCTVIEILDTSGHGISEGRATPETNFMYSKAPGSLINISGSNKISNRPDIIKTDWDFQNTGVGGLDKEFRTIITNALNTRIIDADLAREVNAPPVRGVILYGPPGTGKTLIARQLGKMLNGREPKIVNGPELLSKYVGESEKNVRDLFADAEKEMKEKGDESSIHIIILDEFDALCKKRGSRGDNTGVGENVVNQFLSKMDGVGQLNNILLIAMTNRLDLIDEALLRPGRFEVQIEVHLPDYSGRIEILKLHTKDMRENNRLSKDVSFEELAEQTTNFSGAELAGLVGRAVSIAINRLLTVKNKIAVSEDARKLLLITRADFTEALQTVKPAFGVQEEKFNTVIDAGFGLITYSGQFEYILRSVELLINSIKNATLAINNKLCLLINGNRGSGTTYFGCQVAMQTGFAFMRLIDSHSLVGTNEIQRCSTIANIFEDAYRSENSVIVMDQIEDLIEYNSIGPRFQNSVLHTIKSYLNRPPPKGHKLLVICTTSDINALEQLSIDLQFEKTIHMPSLTTWKSIFKVIEAIGQERFNIDWHLLHDQVRIANLKEENDDDITRLETYKKHEQGALKIGVKDVAVIFGEATSDGQNFDAILFVTLVAAHCLRFRRLTE